MVILLWKENNREEFHTFRGYTLAQFARDDLSASMEDYLEMIYRLSRGGRADTSQ